jgi:hypothetical protein
MRIAKGVIVLIVAAAIRDIANGQSLSIAEFYSNADGTVQFIELDYDGPPSSLAGLGLVSRSGSTQATYTFPVNLSDEAPGRQSTIFVVATQGFADRYSIQPDFILPDNFLSPAPAGSLSVSVAPIGAVDSYMALPTDGAHALYATSDYDIGGYSNRAGPAVAVNHAGKYVALAPIDVVEGIEYYNAGLDDYFLTSYPDEIMALDRGDIPGWQRTGYAVPTWTGPPVDTALVPRVNAVCRVYHDGSHFYALSGGPHPLVGAASECLVASGLPGSLVESWSAFYASEPDAVTGACPSDQTPLFRLWNPQGIHHRYTTDRKVRDEMLSRGYVAEGYGHDAVEMCVPDTSPH